MILKAVLGLFLAAHAQIAANVDFLHTHPIEQYTVRSSQAGIDITTAKVSSIVGDFDQMQEFKFNTSVSSTGFMHGDRVIVINSGGGYVSSGISMIQALEAEKATGTRIVCVVVGNAHSMAFNLLSHCDVRLATKESKMVAHKIRAMLSPFTAYTAAMLRRMAKDIDRDDEPFRQRNAKEMHLSLKSYDKFADNETMWDATTLLKIGYLHGLID